MKITKEWLKRNQACDPGLAWFQDFEKKNDTDIFNLIHNLPNFNWQNWLITMLLKDIDIRLLVKYVSFTFKFVGLDDYLIRETIKAVESITDENTIHIATHTAAYAAAYAANENNIIQRKIINNGIKLIKEGAII